LSGGGRVGAALDQLRISLGEVDALADVTAESFDSSDWGDADPKAVDQIASLLGLLEKSATASMAAFHTLHGAIADAAPAPPGERWTEDGTAPGKGSAEDAAIVRRIRELCPDHRYDGSSDEELIQLFKRNRQVLNRSDEDVIAAMVHPR
jgi:hypothetical protein